MRIAVVGADARAEAIASLLLGAGHGVTMSPPGGGAVDAPVVLFAGPRKGLADPGPRLSPQAVVIDAMDGRATLETERALAEYGSPRVVRALVVLPQPGANILCCSDDPDAMKIVEELFRSCGCVPTDRGPLANLTELEPPDPRLGEQFARLKGVNQAAESAETGS